MHRWTALAFALGLVAGGVAMRSSTTPAAPAPPIARAPVATATLEPIAPAPPATTAPTATTSTTTAAAAAPTAPTTQRETSGDCEAQLREVRTQLVIARNTGGTDPSPWPSDVEDMWRERPMRSAVDAALAELGGGEVTSTDCIDYPCIVWAKFKCDGDTAIREALPKTRALAPYGRLTTFIVPRQTGDCGVAVFRIVGDDKVQARTLWRFQAMVDSLD